MTRKKTLSVMDDESAFRQQVRMAAVQVAGLRPDELSAALEAYKDMIGRTTLATAIARGTTPDDFVSQKWDINGKKAELGIAKA